MKFQGKLEKSRILYAFKLKAQFGWALKHVRAFKYHSHPVMAPRHINLPLNLELKIDPESLKTVWRPKVLQILSLSFVWTAKATKIIRLWFLGNEIIQCDGTRIQDCPFPSLSHSLSLTLSFLLLSHSLDPFSFSSQRLQRMLLFLLWRDFPHLFKWA